MAALLFALLSAALFAAHRNELHQIARLQVNSDIEGHTALADFAPASWQGRLGNSIARQDAYWQIDQMSLPTAGIRGRGSHLRQIASAWMLLLA